MPADHPAPAPVPSAADVRGTIEVTDDFLVALKEYSEAMQAMASAGASKEWTDRMEAAEHALASAAYVGEMMTEFRRELLDSPSST